MTEVIPREDSIDFALAAELQAALLPKMQPEDWEHHDIAVHNRMCRTIGGDFYDFIRINREQLAVVMGDVVGHGISASLIMAQIMGFLRSDQPKLTRPGQVVSALNEMLIKQGEHIDSKLPCSIFYAVLDAPSGSCFYVNAGHLPPLIGKKGETEVDILGAHDMLLGVREFTPVDRCITFSSAQRIVIYTDGVTDTMNPIGHRLGSKPIRTIMSRFHDRSAKFLSREFFLAVDRFRSGHELIDDQSILVIDGR